MALVWSRFLALAFAIVLAIGEAVINWGHWQFAPLWIVDYFIAGWLLWSVYKTRSSRNIHVLLCGWAFTAGVFYIAFFAGLDPENASNTESNMVLVVLIGLMLAWSVVGFLCALVALHAQQRTAPHGGTATAVRTTSVTDDRPLAS